FQRREHKRPFGGTADGPGWPFQSMHGRIAVDTDNERSTFTPRRVDDFNMARMQQVKDAIGEDHGAAHRVTPHHGGFPVHHLRCGMARRVSRYHRACVPSMMSFTIVSMALRRPLASAPSAYWPSRINASRLSRMRPVVWSTISMSMANCKRRRVDDVCLGSAPAPAGKSTS